MMRSLSRLHRPVRFESSRWVDSETVAGVRFAVRKPSLGQRLELTRRVYELTLRHEFLKAGSETEKLEEALGELMVQQLYIEWGLKTIEGLEIDGEPATPAALIDSGPEELAVEIASCVVRECGLTEDERKNF
jgi:hypothetical protein